MADEVESMAERSIKTDRLWEKYHKTLPSSQSMDTQGVIFSLAMMLYTGTTFGCGGSTPASCMAGASFS